MPPKLISKKEGILVKGKVKSQADQKREQADQKREQAPQKRVQVDHKKETDKLDKKTISKFKRILLKEREQIVGEVKQIVESSKEMGQDGTQDIGDEAANIYNKQILLSLNENERMRLQEVDESLDRIHGKTYGICEECGEPIGLKRLEVKPVAKYCIDCQAKIEKERI